MKRYSLIICLVLIVSLSGVASAQVLIDAGGPATLTMRVFGKDYGPYPWMWLSPYVGHSSHTTTVTTTTYYYQFPATAIFNSQAAFEFYLGPVNPTNFTSKGFTARLGGLVVISEFGTGSMGIDLFDMGDGTEDGYVFDNEYNSKRCNRIDSRTQVLTPANPADPNADFDNIDVTCAVRNDLFGAGLSNISGFILKSPDATGIQYVKYDPTTPTLTINPGNPGPDCPDCGGGGDDGGGCFIANAAR